MVLALLVYHVRKPAVESWIELEAAHNKDEIVTGVISGKVKGGFTVDVRGLRAFLPGHWLTCDRFVRLLISKIQN